MEKLIDLVDEFYFDVVSVLKGIYCVLDHRFDVLFVGDSIKGIYLMFLSNFFGENEGTQRLFMDFCQEIKNCEL